MWISCLLIGSIICSLLQTDVYAAPQGVYMPEWGYWTQDYYDPSQLPEALSSSDASQNTPERNEFQGPSLDTLPYWGPGYEAGSPGYVDWYGAAFAPPYSGGQWHASTGYGQKDELDQPVLSDVSQLDPVYSYDSGSRYKRGRVVFALSRYIPGEPSNPFGPFKKPSAKPHGKRPARPGGF